MTSMTTEQLPPPAGGPGTSASARERAVRMLAFETEQATDVLAGRTVWCVSALPSGALAAGAVRRCLDRPDGGAVATGGRELRPVDDPQLRQLAARLEAMLDGRRSERDEVSAAQRVVYADGVRDSEALLGPDVRDGDVVLLHDVLAALLADAVRARGAHAVWHVAARGHDAGAAAARGFLSRFTRGVDAFVGVAPAPLREQQIARLAVALPSPGRIVVKEVVAPDEPRAGLGWRSLLADVVGNDREEHVGGTLHARPAVPVH